MSENTQSQSPSTSVAGMSLEEQLAYMTKHIEKIQSENPDQDLKTGSQWCAPVINLGADVKVTNRPHQQSLEGRDLVLTPFHCTDDLDKEINEKLTACFAKLAARNYVLDAIDDTSAEAREILVDHLHMLARMDAAIFQKDALAKVREYAASETAAGRVPGSCTVPPK